MVEKFKIKNGMFGNLIAKGYIRQTVVGCDAIIEIPFDSEGTAREYIEEKIK